MPCGARRKRRNRHSLPTITGKKTVINVAFKPAHSAIVRLMDWQDSGVTHKVTGIFVAEENAIIYDLTRATEYKTKGGKDEE